MPSAASDRPLALRSRSDLQIRPQWFAGVRYFHVKDPLALRYYQLREEEYFILQQLDGRRSPASIQDAYAEEFAPRRISVITSFSRGVRLASSCSSSRSLSRFARRARSLSKARSTASSKALSLTGFSRKSTAPSFTAVTAVARLP